MLSPADFLHRARIPAPPGINSIVFPPACIFCEGFYGPNHDQPLCAPCHSLTTPPSLTIPHRVTYQQGQPVHRDGDGGTPEESEMPQDVQPLCRFSPDSAASELGAMDALPNEMLGLLFGHFLDDISLACASQVSQRWRNLILALPNRDESYWKTKLKQRWPLWPLRTLAPFSSQSSPPVCSFQTYIQLLRNLPCLRCFCSLQKVP